MKLREGLFSLIPTKLTKLHHLQDFCANFLMLFVAFQEVLLILLAPLFSCLHVCPSFPYCELQSSGLWSSLASDHLSRIQVPRMQKTRVPLPVEVLSSFPLIIKPILNDLPAAQRVLWNTYKKRFNFSRKYLKTHCWAQAAQWGSPLSMFFNPSKGSTVYVQRWPRWPPSSPSGPRPPAGSQTHIVDPLRPTCWPRAMRPLRASVRYLIV